MTGSTPAQPPRAGQLDLDVFAPIGGVAVLSVLGALAVGRQVAFVPSAIWWVAYVSVSGLLSNGSEGRKLGVLIGASVVGGLVFCGTFWWWSVQAGLSQISGGELNPGAITFLLFATSAGIFLAAIARSVLVQVLDNFMDADKLTRFQKSLNIIIGIAGTLGLTVGSCAGG